MRMHWVNCLILTQFYLHITKNTQTQHFKETYYLMYREIFSQVSKRSSKTLSTLQNTGDAINKLKNRNMKTKVTA